MWIFSGLYFRSPEKYAKSTAVKMPAKTSISIRITHQVIGAPPLSFDLPVPHGDLLFDAAEDALRPDVLDPDFRIQRFQTCFQTALRLKGRGEVAPGDVEAFDEPIRSLEGFFDVEAACLLKKHAAYYNSILRLEPNPS